MQKQAEAIADAYTELAPADGRASDIRAAKVLNLSKQGLTQTQIAQQLAISQATVSRILDRFVDTRDLAKLKLHNSAASLAERVVREADVEQSLEVLDRIDVVQKRSSGGSGYQGVQVIVMQPGQTSLQPPVIDLSPTPFALPCAETGQAK